MMEYNKYQEREVFTSVEYDEFDRKLFSPGTSVDELKTICIQLGRTPSVEAQELLTAFQESERAHEVRCLDMVIREGRRLYLEPVNETEERDYLALTLMRELSAEIAELREKYRNDSYIARKMAIENQAVSHLILRGDIEAEDKNGLEEVQRVFEESAALHRREVEKKKKVLAWVRESITTQRYLDLEPDDIFSLT